MLRIVSSDDPLAQRATYPKQFFSMAKGRIPAMSSGLFWKVYCSRCDELAFLVSYDPRGELMRSDGVFYGDADRRPVLGGESVDCWNCHRFILGRLEDPDGNELPWSGSRSKPKKSFWLLVIGFIRRIFWR